MDLVRFATTFERSVTNFVAAALRATVAVAARLLGRGRHRDWRKRAEAEEARRRRGRSA